MRILRWNIFYGWFIVGACLVIVWYGSGTFFYGFGAFFDPIRENFGWTYGATALAFSLYRLEGGVAAPLVGFLVDRYGPRRIMMFGITLMGLGFMALSLIQNIWMFYGSFLLLAAGFSAGSGMVGMTAVANWFYRYRGRAMALMMMGPGLSGVLAPVLVWIVDTYDWRTALRLVGVGIWLVGYPVASLVRHKPEQYGYLPDGAAHPGADDDPSIEYTETGDPIAGGEINFRVGEAMRSRSFWLLALALSLSGMSVGSLVVHEIPRLTDAGIPRSTAGLTITVMTLLSLSGRLSFGFAGDFIERRYLMAAAYALQGVGVLIFANLSATWQLIPFLLIFAPAYGGPIPTRPALQADYFGRQNFGTIQGVMMGFTTVGGIFGPWFAGFLKDVTGSYTWPFTIFAGLCFLAVPVMLAATRPAGLPATSEAGPARATLPPTE